MWACRSSRCLTWTGRLDPAGFLPPELQVSQVINGIYHVNEADTARFQSYTLQYPWNRYIVGAYRSSSGPCLTLGSRLLDSLWAPSHLRSRLSGQFFFWQKTPPTWPKKDIDYVRSLFPSMKGKKNTWTHMDTPSFFRITPWRPGGSRWTCPPSFGTVMCSTHTEGVPDGTWH